VSGTWREHGKFVTRTATGLRMQHDPPELERLPWRQCDCHAAVMSACHTAKVPSSL